MTPSRHLDQPHVAQLAPPQPCFAYGTTSHSRLATSMTELPHLPESLTSFGAEIADDQLYVYGGHTGSAHSYSIEEQSGRFWKLDLTAPQQWEQLPAGPRLQGLALVRHGNAVIRIGGFTALNAKDEEGRLSSQADVARFVPDRGEWTALPPLPEPRSSFDAAVVDGWLYVAGGWDMQPDAETRWSTQACRLNLDDPNAAWESIPDPALQRRALAVETHQGNVFVLGGMDVSGRPTTQVAVYDPAAKSWTDGPSLPGEPMAGFGCAAASLAGELYVSTYAGDLVKLAGDAQSWLPLGELKPARFFHQLLPHAENKLLVVGGANMELGKLTEIEVIKIPV